MKKKKLDCVNGRSGGEGKSNFMCLSESTMKKVFVMAGLYAIWNKVTLFNNQYICTIWTMKSDWIVFRQFCPAVINSMVTHCSSKGYEAYLWSPAGWNKCSGKRPPSFRRVHVPSRYRNENPASLNVLIDSAMKYRLQLISSIIDKSIKVDKNLIFFLRKLFLPAENVGSFWNMNIS
jgi:hypothetical protein